MRICISGTGCQGKSTLIESFLEKWSTYTTPKKTYRDLILKENLSHSKYTNKDTQWAILNNIIDEMQRYDKDDNVVFDRGPLDNLVYTMWAYSKGVDDIDDKYVGKTIDIVKESIKSIDINFLIPITKFNDFKYSDAVSEQKSVLDKSECVDEEFINECNTLFQAIKQDWETNPETKFFDVRDMPAIIEVFGTPQQRIDMISLYIDDTGQLIDDTGILNEMDLYEQDNLKDQFGIETDAPKIIKAPHEYQ